ncbi:MAG: HAMP domain-containing sensor histidine kinase [Candidatus Contendobacter sp.]|nr:HAMP domain-containing sensor histidine kinase [Candidatus Contendobacter sp.]MDS4059098.1 HAMP domain-containing sensor histidine kinase [Candidatus Contendobacter sp.]
MPDLNALELWKALVQAWGGQTVQTGGQPFTALSRLPLTLASGEQVGQIIAVFDWDSTAQQAVLAAMQLTDQQLRAHMRDYAGNALSIGNDEFLGLVVLSAQGESLPESMDPTWKPLGGKFKFYGPQALESFANRFPAIHQQFFGEMAAKLEELRVRFQEIRSEKGKLENELKRYQHEYQVVAGRQKRLEQAEAWQKLIDTVQHKLSTKLGSLKLLVDFHRRRARADWDEDVFERLHKITNEVQDRLNLLEGRRVQGLDRREQDIQDVVSELRSVAETRQIPFAARPGTRGRMEVDRAGLVDCVEELIANARYWTDWKTDKSRHDKPARIEISVSLRLMPDGERMLEIVCQDDGPGIDDGDKMLIFHPYMTWREGGKGLGLHMLKRFCELHRGEIFENGKFGQGARFVMRLPVKQDTSNDPIDDQTHPHS